jgi:asparagine synthase (glutamine-hydrolysing)
MMCGIFGAQGHHLTNSENALQRLTHRGPDGQAVIFQSEAYLGHTRLAIVDVDGGQQPISDNEGMRWLVCNGEIYNHPALREQFSSYPYKTHSDSEDILAVYERHLTETPAYLQGMFAFALLDGDNLFLARDPLGIKPLYYGWANETLHFASEIKALQDVVEQVQEFPAGHWYSTQSGFVEYFNLQAAAAPNGERSAPNSTAIREQLQKSVESHLMTDVPLGVFLSGGLDSSIIAAVVKEGFQELNSFAVGMEGSADLAHARQAANMLGTRHFEYVYTEQEMIESLPTVIYHLESFDPALVRSAIANYFLARLASEHVTVILSGEGADELFSGYQYLNRFWDGVSLHQELVSITAELHNRNLQRLDRMTMAHGLEGRVPFLDRAFVEFAFSVPIQQKLHHQIPMEKWILRKAFEDKLPAEVVWRKKEKFAKGAGSAHVFEQIAGAEISNAEFTQAGQEIFEQTGHQIRSKEELYYYRIFRRFFKDSVIPLVGFSRSL